MILTMRRYSAFYLMAIPGLLYYFIFHYLPMAGVLIAFQDYSPLLGIKGVFTSPWVGLQHFETFFSSPYFIRILQNTVIISGLKLLFGFPAPVLLALLLNELRGRIVKRFVQTISYLPHFLSWVVVAGMMILLMSPSLGIANPILERLGFDGNANLLGSSGTFRTVLVASSVWKEIGWNSIIYLAAISGINPQLYEAAEMDGASRWKQVRHITIPSLRHVMSILFILQVGHLLDAGFEQVFLLYSPAVYAVGDIIDTYVYREGLIGLNYSFASAVGLFKSVIAMILILSANRLAKRLEAEGLW
ncbi:ABC transporter permease [Paenibacillus sp. MBLB4367]|uniref:ABC transporter permease n=1 Tax=Paenibacillus sp. MBLB4367 TaxID=3384767 RepID=UPI0039082469